MGELRRGTDPASSDRALEVLCCLVTKTAFKDELAFGSGCCQSCVPLIVEQVREVLRARDWGKGSWFVRWVKGGFSSDAPPFDPVAA